MRVWGSCCGAAESHLNEPNWGIWVIWVIWVSGQEENRRQTPRTASDAISRPCRTYPAVPRDFKETKKRFTTCQEHKGLEDGMLPRQRRLRMRENSHAQDVVESLVRGTRLTRHDAAGPSRSLASSNQWPGLFPSLSGSLEALRLLHAQK